MCLHRLTPMAFGIGGPWESKSADGTGRSAANRLSRLRVGRAPAAHPAGDHNFHSISKFPLERGPKGFGGHQSEPESLGVFQMRKYLILTRASKVIAKYREQFLRLNRLNWRFLFYAQEKFISISSKNQKLQWESSEMSMSFQFNWNNVVIILFFFTFFLFAFMCFSTRKLPVADSH